MHQIQSSTPKANSPFLFEYRQWVAIVYIAVCYGLCMWLGEVFTERINRGSRTR